MVSEVMDGGVYLLLPERHHSVEDAGAEDQPAAKETRQAELEQNGRYGDAEIKSLAFPKLGG